MSEQAAEVAPAPCFHCGGSGRCTCPFCSPGYEIHDGDMRAAEGRCIAPHGKKDSK